MSGMRNDGNKLIHTTNGLCCSYNQSFFSDLKEEPNDSNDFKNACKFITRCVELEEKGKLN